jgi:uncharacterized repeat protein (TIGR03806 family)
MGFMALALMACDTDPSATPPFSVDVNEPGNTDIYEPSDNRPANATCLAPPRPPPPGFITLEPVFTDVLSPMDAFKLVELKHSPVEAGRWYVAQHSGRLLTFREDSDGPTVALDIVDKIWTGFDEIGLVSFVFHPDFVVNGHVFVSYGTPSNASGGFSSRIARFTSTDDGLTFPRESEHVILDIPQPHGTHSGNHVLFGPDGYLYYCLGDGSNPYDPYQNGQNPNTLYGALLRLDVNQSDPTSGTNYAIPPDNPFVDGGGAPEVFAYGLRNPWRFTFDRETGEIWIGDVGQDTREEIDRIIPGGNYGWSIKEGELCFDTFEPDTCDATGLIEPYWAYSHNEGASVTAGYVYRGAKIPELYGRYVFADYINGNIWALHENEDGQVINETQLESGVNIPSFAEDPDGELYVVGFSWEDKGGIYRVIPAPDEPNEFPQKLSETGCFEPSDPKTVTPGVIPYSVIAPLWSDGADKGRYLAVPDDRRVSVDEDGDILFPVGSVLIKHFGFGDDLHETRFMINHEDGWAGYSYEWLADQSDAHLLELGKVKELAGGQRWIYPSRSPCLECHTSATNRILGPELLQLNHDYDYGDGETNNQLAQLLAWDYFSPEVTTLQDLGVDALPIMPDPAGEAPLDERARSYLHANCAICHQPGGTTAQADIDLRYTTPFTETGLCNAKPENGRLYLPNPNLKLLIPKTPDESILYLRMVTLNVFRMPPVSSQVIDEEGADLIRSWIESIESCQ